MEWTSYFLGVIIVAVSGLYIRHKRRQQEPREAGKDYPSDTVILHQFPRGPFAPSMSPFCVKLETFLRMANIPYQNVYSYKTGPKKKIPWIEYNNEVLGDSELIMTYLCEKLEMNLNKSLTPEQRATARAFQKMVDEHMYWTVLLERWVYHRSDSIKAKLSKLPSIVLWEIGRRTNKMAYAQGIGRHAQPEVDRILSEDMKALSEFLGDKKFMFGDEPSQVDCAVFGQLTQVIYHVPDSVQAKHTVKGTLRRKIVPISDMLQYRTESFANLSSYCERMKEKYWPDWDECITNGFTKEATK